MAKSLIRIGTRGSQLALAQAHETRDRLVGAHGANAIEVEIEVISTKGDRVLDRALSEIGGKGLFTEEIEEKLANGSIDIAVHSTKDMPTVLPQGLELSCYLEREAPNDAFISPKAKTIMDLPQGAVVGSASLRRQAMLKRLRPDLKVITFRGNVQTRLAKLEAGDVDATLLAQAGLNRLGMAHIITHSLSIDEFLPAPGQGAICIESRIGDKKIADLLKPLSHDETRITIATERAFLARLDGSCRTPLAGHAILNGNKIQFHGMILSPDGATVHETRTTGGVSDAISIGTEAADILREAAGDKFFADWV